MPTATSLAEQFRMTLFAAAERWMTLTEPQFREAAAELVKDVAAPPVSPHDRLEIATRLSQAAAAGSIEAAAALMALGTRLPEMLPFAIDATTALVNRSPDLSAGILKDIGSGKSRDRWMGEGKVAAAGVDDKGRTVYRLTPEAIAAIEELDKKPVPHNLVLAIERIVNAADRGRRDER